MKLFSCINSCRVLGSERTSVRHLIRIGARITFERPFWCGRSNVVAVRFRGLNVESFPFDELRALTSLRGLDVCNTTFNDDQAKFLSNLVLLEFLFACNTLLTSDSGPELCRLAKLKMLDLRNCRFTSDSLARIENSIRNCRIYHELRPTVHGTVEPTAEKTSGQSDAP
jgi:hypothetical protein